MKVRDLNFKRDFFLITAFLTFGLIPISSQRIETLLTIFFLLFIVIHSLKNGNGKNSKNLFTFLLNGSLFFILLTTLKDSFDILTLKKIEQMLSLLLFPTIFFLLSREGNNKIMKVFGLWKKVFVLSAFFLAIFSFLLAFNYTNPKYPNLDSNFFRQAISESSYFSRNPMYISLYLNISILICFDFIFKSKKLPYKFLLILLIFISSSLVLVLSVKMAIIALVFCLLVYLLLNLKIKNFLITASILLTSVILFISYGSNKINRFSELFDKNVLNKNTPYNSVFVHKQTIICATKVFKNNFFLGVGLENSSSIVNNCVRDTYKHNEGVIYNSHNQYLSYAIHSGILGVLLLCFVLFIALKKSIKNEPVLFTMILYFTIIFLTENVLERQSGLILFAFLLNFVPNLSPYKK